MTVRKYVILSLVLFILAAASACRSDSISAVNNSSDNSTPGNTKNPAANEPRRDFIRGTVVHISDGDTFIIEDEKGKRATVRIHAIDAPELAQEFGRESRENLRALIAGQQVEVRKRDTDRFQRVVGTVFTGQKDIGLAQVAGGFAWHFKQYQKEQPPGERQAYAAAEDAARASRVGLWGPGHKGEPLSPQDYRRSSDTRR